MMPERAELPQRSPKVLSGPNSEIVERAGPYGWRYNPETRKHEPIYDPDYIAGVQVPLDDLHNRAHAFYILNFLIEHEDVYQVNIYQQAKLYTVTITLKATTRGWINQQRFQVGLAAIGFPAEEKAPERRTITSHGTTLVQAILHAATDFETYGRSHGK